MGTVSKALELLNHFTHTRREIGLSDLARRAGMNKATVHRLMGELAEFGLVEQTGGDRAYRLGPALPRLAQLREAAVPVRAAATAALQGLADETGETAHLSVLEGTRLATYAYAYAAAHGISVRMEDAELLPLHATSSGLAVLAFAGDGFRDRVLAAPLRRFTPLTPVTRAEVEGRLRAVRARGHSESMGGFEAEVHSLSVPLFDAAGRVTGALAVAAPATRMNDPLRNRVLAALPGTARRIAALWGGLALQDIEKGLADAV